MPRLPFTALLLAATTAQGAYARPEEGVLTDPLAHPAPYAVSASVLASTPAVTQLEIVVTPQAIGQIGADQPVSAGLVAIAPTGAVTARIVQVEDSPPADFATLRPLDVATMPDGLVTLGTPGIWRDIRVVQVAVAPFISTPDGDIQVRRLVVEIVNTGGVGENEKTRPVRPVSPVWERMYRDHVLNYDSLNLPRLERGTGKRYIVISRTAFDAQTPQFVDWKTRQGYGVEVVTLESLGYTNPQLDAAMNATKDWILSAYSTWPETPEFVLLVGDMSTSSLSASIWTKNFYNYFYGQGNRPHDQWYGFLEGNDLFADIMVGRFPDTNSTRMSYQLAKTVSYEKTPYMDGTWQKNAIMTLDSSIGATITTKNTVSDRLQAWGMNVSEFFGYPWNVIPVINQGLTFYNYRGDNCSSTSWGSTFSDWDVPYVNNANKPGVWTVISCSSAHFDNNTSTAEALLRHDYTNPSTPKGAVAFIGSQAYTAYEYNNPLDIGIYRAWADSGASLLGEAFLSGKIWAWNNMYPGFDPNRRDCMMREYTILGDPSLQVWTKAPGSMIVEVDPPIVTVGQTTDVTVTVSNAILGPLRGALVCLDRSSDVFEYGYTNTAGTVTLPVSPQGEGTIDVTVTSYNYRPFLGTITTSTTIPPTVPENVVASATPQGDLELTWSPVTEDVLGNPIGIDHYEIHRHTAAHFLPNALTWIADTALTSYTDIDAASDPSVDHFYRIVAVSASVGSSSPSATVGEIDFEFQP